MPRVEISELRQPVKRVAEKARRSIMLPLFTVRWECRRAWRGRRQSGRRQVTDYVVCQSSNDLLPAAQATPARSYRVPRIAGSRRSSRFIRNQLGELAI